MNKSSNSQDTALLSDIQTRLAVVEEKQRQAENDRSELKTELKDVRTTLTSIDTKVDMVNEGFAKLKGTWGGIILAVGAVATALSFAWDWIVKLLKG